MNRFAALAGAVAYALFSSACSIVSTRPAQEMSDTAAAIRAAREVQADVFAPEPYREANEWFFKAKNEYRVKNFSEASSFARTARGFAEQAEFESLLAGGNRGKDETHPDPFAQTIPGAEGPPSHAPMPTPARSPYPYPTPTGTFIESIENKAAPSMPGTAPGAP